MNCPWKKAALLLLALLLVLAGCSSDGGEVIVRCDITGTVDNLDPQYATGATAKMLILNLYEGLLVREPDGTLSPGVAEENNITSDGLTYTFRLRRDASYSDGTNVTADDFVFALRRLFSPSAPSPHAQDFLSIQNAREVLAGGMEDTELGVEAVGSHSLRITLEREDPFFLEMLATAAAVPCNRAFFSQSRGRYGLEKQYVYGNGPFTLTTWNNEKNIQLRANEHYASEKPALCGGVNLYIGRENSAQRFLDGTIDVGILAPEGVEPARDRGYEVIPYQDTVWCLVFNQDTRDWGNPFLRQALAMTVDTGALAERLPAQLEATTVFVPPAMLLGSTSYRQWGPAQSPLTGSASEGSRFFEMGMDMLGYNSLPPVSVLVPSEGEHAQLISLAQQGWQKYLFVYIQAEEIPAEEVNTRFAGGDYQMLLTSFSMTDSRMESFLGQFASGSRRNYTGYENPVYDELLEQARDQVALRDAGAFYEVAEKALLTDAVVVPLYMETTFYALGENIRGIWVYPYGGHLYFKYAQRI